tara:strand:+ start:10 stop:1539 length:1530 start_codon:yes stop_codon:yes gene_type:complete
MSITKITTPKLLDFPKDSTSSVNTSGTVIPTGTGSTNACNFPTFSSGVALYQLNDLTDTCGNWSNATNVGSATFTPGKFGDALTLNGSSQYLTLSDTWIYSNNFSCSVWVYIHDFTPTTSIPMVLGFWGSGSYAWFIELDASGTPKFNAYMYGPALRIGSTSTLALNTWYHIVFTTSSTGGKKLYLNGVLEGNNADTQDATTTAPDANFIGQSTWGNDYFDGQIDQLRFYNSVLTQTQITELYNETTTEVYRPTTSLNLGEFRFNTTTGYVEYYDGSTWLQIADEYISGQPTTCICNYPSNTTPIALYQLDNVTETCGSWNSATNVGSATFTSGKFGDALTLTGGQYLTLSDTWTYDNNFSCSVWVYMDSIAMNGHFPGIVGFWGTGGYDWMIEFDNYVASPVFNLVMYTSSSSQRAGTTTPLAINTWYHIVVTASSTEGKKIYLNGTLETTNANTSGLLNSYSDDNRIGSSRWGSTTDWDGKIDQLRFYDGVLTATQVTELYNEVICN